MSRHEFRDGRKTGVVVQRRTGRELRCEMSVWLQISLRPIISWSVASGGSAGS